MGDVLAIVAKAVFDGARGPGGGKLGVGDTWPTDRYVSANKGLSPLAAGGDLYLVTVRPGDVLWLVGVLRRPTHDGAQWVAPPNVEPIRELTAAIPALRFANGKGLQVKPGALGMSLQTPRPLAASDLLVLGASAAAPPPTPPTPPPPDPPPAEAKAKAAPVRPPPPEGGASLADVLAAWRVDPRPELIPQALALSLAHESAAAAALRPGDKAVDDDAWDAVAAADRPEDVGALCATFHRTALPSLKLRAATIAELPPDPRVAHLLHQLLRVPPFRATSSQPVWNVLFDAVLRHPDPQTLAVVREIAAAEFPSGAAFQAYMANKLAAAEKKLAAAGVVAAAAPAPAPLPPRAPAAPLAPAALPTAGAATGTVTVGNTTVRLLRRAPSATWAVAWVADPVDSEDYGVADSAALVPFLLPSLQRLPTLPLPPSAPRVFALGHAPGTLAVAVGSRLRVHQGGVVREWPAPTHGVTGPAETDPDDEDVGVTALAFGEGDRELFVVAWLPDPGRKRGGALGWAVVDLGTGAVTFETKIEGTYRWRDDWREVSAWCTDRRLVFSGGREALVWDRRWGAWAQNVGYEGGNQVVVGATHLSWAPRQGKVPAVRVDLATGWTEPTVEGLVVDLLGDAVAVRAWGKRGGITGPVERVERGQRVAVPVGDPGHVALTPAGVLVGEGERVTHHPGGGEVRWSAAVATAVAAAGSARAVGCGSLVTVGGRQLREDGTVRALALSPSGDAVYLGVKRSVKRVPLGKGKARTMAAHAYPVTCLAAADDGAVVSGGEDHLVVVWEADGALRHKLGGHPGVVLGVATQGGRVASTGDDGVLRLHDLASGASLGQVAAPRATGPVAWSAGGEVLVWLVPEGLAWEGGLVPLPSPTALAAHPSRPGFVVATADGALHAVWPGSGARELLRGLRAPAALAFAGDRLLVGCGAPGEEGAACEVELTWGGR